MGREVKRVALDFDWPVDEVWKGYLMPENIYAGQCGHCNGSGYNRETKFIADSWYTHTHPLGREGWCSYINQSEVDALVKGGRLYDFTHRWVNEDHPLKPMSKEDILKFNGIDGKFLNACVKHGSIIKSDDMYTVIRGWFPRDDGYIPTATEVNEWGKTGMGHDAINRFICIETRAKNRGVWGKCSICEGTGELWRDDAHKKAHDEWEAYDPPVGDGWQLWETVTEGSPQSPVFKTKEELSLWMQANGDGNSNGYSKESADAFVNQGWAPSFMAMDGILMSGVDAAAKLKE